jgi:hypothetical protein
VCHPLLEPEWEFLEWEFLEEPQEGARKKKRRLWKAFSLPFFKNYIKVLNKKPPAASRKQKSRSMARCTCAQESVVKTPIYYV